MRKYLSLLGYEFKTILRDPLNMYMLLFPFIILALSAYVFPLWFESMDPANAGTYQALVLLLLVMVIAMGSYFIGAMATFLLIENKDEHTLHTIAVTPVGTSGYLWFKMLYVYALSVIGTLIIVQGTKILAGDRYVIGTINLFDNIHWAETAAFALVGSLFVPALALFQGALAKNKVEGFAYIKATGMLALLPALMILETFHGGLQYVLGIFPNFWALKGIMVQLFPAQQSANLSFQLYLLIGAVFNLFLIAGAYKMFLRKAQY